MMSEKNPSQTQQNTARFESFLGELTKLEEKNIEAANRAIDESSRLMKETISYGAKLSAEWRAMALKTSRQAAEMMGWVG
jgi:hypothetical protein